MTRTYEDIDALELLNSALAYEETQTDSETDEDAHPTDTPLVVDMGNGRFHVCGPTCPHVCQSTDNERNLVCQLSGRVVSNSIECSQDSSWTGRSCGSADPDMASGSFSTRVWRQKRDAFAESARAYNNARQFTAECDAPYDQHSYQEAIEPNPDSSSKFTGQKRGALCISDVDETAISELRKAKSDKRIASLSRREVQARLCNDAFSVVKKLFTSTVGADSKKFENDPRLENYTFVMNVGLKKYVQSCIADNKQVSLSEMHDIAICASNFVRDRRKDGRAHQANMKARMLVANTRTVDLCARLIVSIWNAVCNTSHFVDKQTGDSFRPFAAGILYAMKRGLRLKSNLVVVPQMNVLSDQLPTLKSSSSNSEARQLQASSHRGLCVVHRAIASIETMNDSDKGPVIEKLKLASSICTSLELFAHKFMHEDAKNT